MAKQMGGPMVDTVIQAIDKVRSFADLAQNWDSYGAGPIGDDVIERAITAARAIYQQGPFTPVGSVAICPTSPGSIMFEWDAADGVGVLLEIEERR